MLAAEVQFAATLFLRVAAAIFKWNFYFKGILIRLKAQRTHK